MKKLLGFTYLDENKRNGYYVVTRVPEWFDTKTRNVQFHVHDQNITIEVHFNYTYHSDGIRYMKYTVYVVHDEEIMYKQNIEYREEKQL